MTNRQGENVIQAAMIGALEVYFDRQGVNFQQFAPYSNQQGIKLRRFCGDVLGLIDNSSILLLEMKELNCSTKQLMAFDKQQHQNNVEFEKIGIPIGYAYNKCSQLLYHQNPRAKNWPSETLSSINRAKPSILPNEYPEIDKHSDLLSWIESTRKASGKNNVAAFGQLLGIAISPQLMTNGLLTLLYSVDQGKFFTLEKETLKQVYEILMSSPAISHNHRAYLDNVLGEASNVFNQFSQIKDETPHITEYPPPRV